MFKAYALFLSILALSLSLAPAAEAQNRRQQARPATAAAPVVLSRSDSDLYAATLAGRFAEATDNPVLAASAWTRAYLRRPNDGELFQNAVATNMHAGDIATAVRLAKLAPATLQIDDAALVLAIDAFAQGRYADVSRVLTGRNFQPSQRVFADHLHAYALIGQNKPREAIEVISRATGIAVLDKATLMSRAIILDRVSRGSEAGILFQSAIDSNVTWPMGVRAYGDWLVTNDRKPDAITLYQTLVRAGGLEAGGFAASLANLQSGNLRPKAQDLRAAAATGLVTIAQSLAAEGRGGAPVVLLNLVAYLDPRSDGVAVALANQLIADSRGDRAKPLLSRIGPTSPDYLAARTELAWLEFGSDQSSAVRIARETLAAMPGNQAATRLLADILAANRDDREAESLYSTLIDKSKVAGQSNEEAWPLYYGRGGARERLGKWPEALADLRLAKSAAPNQPSVLNYLGYALADRGENLDEAITMLRAAVRLRPRSGSVLDSLGWAYFKAGRYEEAVGTLETAAGMAPALAEIGDHLGDAYWRSGREDEARLEWGRALRLDTSSAQKASLEAKIRDGLPPDPSTAARRVLAAQSTPVVPR